MSLKIFYDGQLCFTDMTCVTCLDRSDVTIRRRYIVTNILKIYTVGVTIILFMNF